MRGWPAVRAGRRRDDAAVALLLALLAFALAAGGWLWRADRLVYDTGLLLWQRPAPEQGATVSSAARFSVRICRASS